MVTAYDAPARGSPRRPASTSSSSATRPPWRARSRHNAARDHGRDAVPHAHGRARGAPAVVVGDMPFGSYQAAREAVENAIRFIKEGGADAVKLEGAGPTLSACKSSSRRGSRSWPTSGSRRSRRDVGGFKCRARPRRLRGSSWPTRSRSRRPAPSRSCSRHPARVAPRSPSGCRSRRSASAPAAAPTVRCWSLRPARAHRGPFPPFVKRYANLSLEIRDALEAYADERRAGTFPEDEHTYEMPEEELERFRSSSSPRASEPERPEVARERSVPRRPSRRPPRPSLRIGRRRPHTGQFAAARRRAERARAEPTRRRAGGVPGGTRFRLRSHWPERGRRGRRTGRRALRRGARRRRPRPEPRAPVREHRGVETWPASVVESTTASPPRMTSARTGSCRTSAASSESSRSAANRVPRPLKDRQRAKPPLPLERCGRLGGGALALSVLSAMCPKAR